MFIYDPTFATYRAVSASSARILHFLPTLFAAPPMAGKASTLCGCGAGTLGQRELGALLGSQCELRRSLRLALAHHR